MEDAWKVNKSILDSVHGRIKIPVSLCKAVLDTVFFQRLRRIEQNSCRSVYPSARHDRFIHSLGVYHIGRLIVNHLNMTCEDIFEGIDKNRIFDTYLIACLLHDVGHTPFSHTFEEMYDRDALVDALPDVLEKVIGPERIIEFKENINNPLEKLTHHELISAWLALNAFPESFKELPFNIDWELFVRMIIGLPYVNDRGIKRKSQFENIMIELIHGTIDADGLDYVCRDVWAGGYQNFSVDIHRLIESIKIIKDKGYYKLVFSSKGLNELETYLNVKNFQYFYVINHHKVILEQHYLIEGVKSAAAFHTKLTRDDGIKRLCDFNFFYSPAQLNDKFVIQYPCDDDFVFLMKQTIPFDSYIENWFSRKHSLSPLWKSKIEFFKIFSEELQAAEQYEKEKIDKEEQDGAKITESENAKRCNQALERVTGILCNEEWTASIMSMCGLKPENVYHKVIKPKVRGLRTKEIFIELNDEIINYDDLKYDSFSVIGVDLPFCYLYVDLNQIDKDDPHQARRTIINALKEHLHKTLY